MHSLIQITLHALDTYVISYVCLPLSFFHASVYLSAPPIISVTYLLAISFFHMVNHYLSSTCLSVCLYIPLSLLHTWLFIFSSFTSLFVILSLLRVYLNCHSLSFTHLFAILSFTYLYDFSFSLCLFLFLSLFVRFPPSLSPLFPSLCVCLFLYHV